MTTTATGTAPVTTTAIETAPDTQYIVFSGTEKPADVQRIIDRLNRPFSVTFSYRHIAVQNALFLDLLIVALRIYGIRQFATIYAEDYEVARIQAIADRERLIYTPR
jgi:hypothetical protein